MMRKVLIEGCRAVGKTTLCNNLRMQGVVTFYRERFELNPDFQKPRTKEEFEKQQQWYIAREIAYWQRIDSLKDGLAIVIASPETLDFYTRFYSMAYDKNWILSDETLKQLERLSQYKSDLVIYLTASDDTIVQRMRNDKKKRLEFWDYYNNWQKLNYYYYSKHEGVVFIDTTFLSPDEVCVSVMQYLQKREII